MYSPAFSKGKHGYEVILTLNSYFLFPLNIRLRTFWFSWSKRENKIFKLRAKVNLTYSFLPSFPPSLSPSFPSFLFWIKLGLELRPHGNWVGGLSLEPHPHHLSFYFQVRAFVFALDQP
jgi:hypothetical protein